MAASDQSKKNAGTLNLPISYSNPWFQVLGDHDANNKFIANVGIRFKHFMAVPDPLYQKELGALRMSHDQEENYQFINDSENFHRENGFIYVFVNYVYATFTGNHKELLNIAASLENFAGAMMSVNRYYANTQTYVKLSEYDKLIPCDLPGEFHTVNWQKFVASRTRTDKMQFKVCRVHFLIDTDGEQYKQDTDFTVTQDGLISWNEGKGPGTDPVSGTGKICAIRYEYKPYYYIKSVLKDIRLWPSANAQNGAQSLAAPQLIMVQSDWIFLDRRNNEDQDVAQQLNSPDGSNIGPR